jgi:predicted ATP-dependent serine protease
MPKVETKPHSADGFFDTSFVGRESELDELRGGLSRVLGGRGQFFCIAGEPGIGKTRLAQEIAAAAEQAGASVAWGRCREDGGAPAYWP